MPPKSKASGTAPKVPTTRDLIRTGPKEVQSTGSKHISAARRSKRDDKGQKPTTTRALVLRNTKTSLRGGASSGTKITGREKLDLLAEDLVEQSKQAIIEPLRLDKCVRIAETQFSEYVDDIMHLRDHELFMPIIESEFQSRKKAEARDDGVSWMNNSSDVARAVSGRIHNSYLMASAWHLVFATLIQLQNAGLTDGAAVAQLKNDANLRSLYMILNDLMDIVVNLSQERFAVLATTVEHFSRYFKKKRNAEADEDEFVFDWEELRVAARSFIDSIVIELCFPRGPYPQTVLYQILRDAIDESPKDAKLFPQSLWDAVGEYSEAVALKTMLDTPLLGPEAQAWKDEPRTMPAGYQVWIDAQPMSFAASEKITSFKDTIYPISKTRSQVVLDTMWKQINQNYKSFSGKDIDTLWGLPSDFLKPSPQWKPLYIPRADDEGGPSRLGSSKKPALLAITEHADGSESDDSMPALQEVSDSDSDDVSDSEDEDEDTDGDDSDESGYDTDEEDELRELLREAMDTAVSSPYYSAQQGVPGEEDPLDEEEEKTSNPFLKLLGSLRGRMFASSTKLKGPGVKIPKAAKNAAKKAAAPPPPPKTTGTASGKVTVEDVEDEDDAPSKKKKKKKPKKKKKATTAGDPDDEDIGSPEPEFAPAPATVAPAVTSPPESPAKNKKTPTTTTPKKPSAPTGIAATVPGFTSTTSLLSEQSAAQSARAYLAKEGLDKKESKTKTRSDHASIFSSVKAKFGFGKPPQDEKASTRRAWFQGLPKKTKGLLHQLLRTAEDETRGQRGMKWDQFVKLLTDLGFEMDPSTAGSSVRFDPPNPDDRAISFHKPHPHTEIGPIKLKEWSKKLRTYYGWKPEDITGI